MKYKKLFYFAVALIIALWYFYPPSLNDLSKKNINLCYSYLSQ